MRIIYVIPSLATGGAELQTINHVNYLFKKGMDIQLIILSGQMQNEHLLRIPSDRIHTLGISGRVTIGFNWILKAPLAVLRVSKYFSKPAGIHVIAVLPASHFLFRLLKIFKPQIKLHLYYRDVYYSIYPMNRGFRRLFNGVNNWLSKRMDTSSIFISKSVHDDISSNFHVLNPLIVANSLETTSITGTEGQRYLQKLHVSAKFKVMIPGRLHFKKGHKLFIQAFDDFIKNPALTPDSIQVILVGDGPEKENLKMELAKRNLSKHFIFLGNVPNSLLLSLHHNVDLVVIPSLFEGFGNVAIEGLMQGSLMLVSSADGLAEIIRDGENGYVFEKASPTALLKKLRYLYENRANRQISPGSLQKEFLEKYTLDRQMDTLLAHLSQFD